MNPRTSSSLPRLILLGLLVLALGIVSMIVIVSHAAAPINITVIGAPAVTQMSPAQATSAQTNAKLCSPVPCRAYTSGVSLGKFIEMEGSPRKVTAFVAPGDEQFQRVSVMLFYPDKGMTIIADKRDTNRIDRVGPDFEVLQVSYWMSSTLDGFKTEFQLAQVPEAKWLSVSQDWQGYSAIKIINPFAK